MGMKSGILHLSVQAAMEFDFRIKDLILGTTIVS